MRFFLAAALCVGSLSAQTFTRAAAMDAAINRAVRENQIPGAVVLVGHEGKIIYEKAYGNRALAPVREPMTLDTIFDVASLTKIVATTSGMMKLVSEGKVAVDDPVTKYLPRFQGGHSDITVRDLMTHYSGLRPDLDLEPEWSGYQTGIDRALGDKPTLPLRSKFVYSDINFELLGEIIRQVSGQPENEYLRHILFEPLGMKETTYLPAAGLQPRIAPTETQKDGTILRGVVHDPTARFMGGVAGHAGLFSTAGDLAKFCQMVLDGGKDPAGNVLFPAATIAEFTRIHSPAGKPAKRGLGWDIDSQYSGNRGNLFPVGTSFGHTGFTGTSFWIDPASKTYVILLANSVHPKLRPAITPLRRQVATIAAEAVGYRSRTATGLDVLTERNFDILRGKHVGLITNRTGIDALRRRNIDLMRDAGIDIVALFSPEHGFEGAEDHPIIGDSRDPSTGLRVFSLYGKTLRPTPEMLKGIDTLMFDIQDLGVRFYTYETTMLYAMQEAAKAKIAFVVLDRPNPLTGEHVEGPMLDAGNLSFIGAFRLPLRHGLTIGELARMENAELKLNADLTVVEMKGWKRGDWFDATGLTWVNPSPNIRNLNEAILYPGIGMLESSTNYSVGRGAASPFEEVGAEFIKGKELADYLNARNIPGVAIQATRFKPESSNLAGKSIEGISFQLTDRDAFAASRLGLELALALGHLYPGKMDWQKNSKLIGSTEVVAEIAKGGDPVRTAQTGIGAFIKMRDNYLIYR
jgi:uncharacterized protein YbbC (DUF1343 family)